MKLYVGNLASDVTAEDLRTLMEEIGKVESVTIIKDKASGLSKGFGFVEMSSKDEGQSAITTLHGKELKGKALKVSEARPRNDSRGGRGGFRGARGVNKGTRGGFGGGFAGSGGRRGGYDGGKGGPGGTRGGGGKGNR